jgi:competence protein ComEC
VRRDLRLVPPALAAWAAAGVAIGCPEGLAAAAAVAWVVALASLALRRRVPWVALVLVAAALVLTAAAAGQARREPADLVEAARARHAVAVELVVTGRPVDGRVAASAEGAPVLVFAELPALRIGDTIAATGELERAESGDDVAFLLFAREPVRVVAGPGGPVAAAAELRERFAHLASGLPGPGAGLLPGLAIGDTSAVEPDLDADMKTASLSHLTAVSGSNCVIVVALVFAGAAAVGLGRLARTGAALVALAGFVVLVTPEPSVLRAAVMAGVALVALASSRPGTGIPLLCLAVIVLLVADPWLARSYGFALSVLATTGLLVLASPLAERLAVLLPRWPAMLIAIPAAAQLACQPVLLLLDPALPLYGVPANALAEPAAPLATIAGLAACLLASLAPALAVPAAWLAWLPASWIAAVAGFAAGLPGARSAWPTGPLGVVLLVAVTALVIVLILRTGPARWRSWVRRALVVAAIAYLGAISGSHLAREAGRPSDWEIAMCDVGQGDASVLRSGGAVAVIDTGPEPAPLEACLADLGVDRIQLLVLTHYDLDHVGGVDAVVGRVDRVLIGPPSDAGDTAIADALSAGGATVTRVASGESGALGELAWRVLWPPPSGVEPGNAASVTLLVDGPLDALFLGDLGEESQRRLLGRGGLPRVDVVKVAHHGSADQSAALYEAIGARVGLIGVGAGNRFGHPTAKLLGILAAVGTAAERTDRDGLILVAPGDRPGQVRVWTSGGGVGTGP